MICSMLKMEQNMGELQQNFNNQQNFHNQEQVIEHLTRTIIEHRTEIIEQFCRAYAAQISTVEDFTIENICLVEQEPHLREGCITRRYWFEYKDKGLV